jgi:hypothetical protein
MVCLRRKMKLFATFAVMLMLSFSILPWASANEWAVDSNTIALYHFDDLTDATQNGLDLTGNGNAVLTDENLEWMNNPHGKALKISALGDGVTALIPDEMVLPGISTSPLTFDIWFYPIAYKAYGMSNYQILSLYQSWDCGLEVRDGKWNSPPVPTLRGAATTVITDDQWQQGVSLNAWHFLRITYENDHISVYMDGQPFETGTTSFNVERTSDWMLTLGNFEGYVDEVRISNVVRTDSPPITPQENQPPTVDAGLDQEIRIDYSVDLHGQANDDGLIAATLYTEWSKISGPGTVIFGNENETETSADFSETGSYVLRLSADDEEFIAFDEVAITVVEVPDQSTLPFSIVVLPDTQAYSDYYPEKFTSQTQWVADHSENLNIQMVLHEGDIVSHADDPLEWDNSAYSMSILDGVVPHILSVGNHDYNGGRDSSAFNATFPVDKYEAMATFGGVFKNGKLDNSYHLFSAGGVDFLALSLEFGPRDEVLNWADSIISTYPTRRIIIVTHAYLSGDGTRLDQGDDYNPHFYALTGSVNDGEEIWQALVKKHRNIDFVFSGHVRGIGGTGCAHAYRTDLGDYGNVVHQMVANYQDCYNGGDGYLRIITFDPVAQTASVKTYSPHVDAYLTDTDNEFVIHGLDFFDQGPVQNSPPIVEAGAEKSILVGETVPLSGIVYDDGLLYEIPDLQWSKISGPGEAVFSDYLAAVTDVSFSSEGQYILKLRAFDGALYGSDTVSISVITSNTSPVGEEQEISLQEDELLEILLTASDADGDSLIYQIADSPDHGILSGTPPFVTYTPSEDYYGPDSFTFEVSDGKGGTDTATISITVSPINDAPVAEDLSCSTVNETPVIITLKGKDGENDVLSYQIVIEPQYGTLSQNGSTVTYTAQSGFTGTDDFTYVANDGQLESNIASVTIDVGEQGDEFEVDEDTIALYHFDDLTDAGQNGFDLTIQGGAQLTDENIGWMENPHGKALKVMDLGDQVTVSIPDAVVMPGSSPSPLTFEARFYPLAYKAYGVNNHQILTLYQSWDVSLEVRDGKWNSPRVPTVRAGRTTVVTDDQWAEGVSLNEWHTLRMTFDQNLVEVYMDDQLIGSTTTTLNARRTTDWALTLGNFEGYVDEVRISGIGR